MVFTPFGQKSQAPCPCDFCCASWEALYGGVSRNHGAWTFKDAFGGLPRRRGTRRWRFPLVMHDNLEDEMLEFVAKLYVGSLVEKKIIGHYT